MTTYANPGDIADVAPNTKEESSWGNAVRDRVVHVFGSAALRDTALTGARLHEGQFCYQTDTHQVFVYTGSAWRYVSGGATHPYAARAHYAGAGVIGITTAKIPLDTKTGVSYDPGSNFDVVTNHRYTAPVSGLYQVNGLVAAQVENNVEAFLAMVYKNGSLAASGQQLNISSGGAGGAALNVVVVDAIPLVAGDYIELWLNHWSATANPSPVVGSSLSVYPVT